MPTPLVISSSAVRAHLRGESLQQYLALLGTSGGASVIAGEIRAAQKEVERRTFTYLSQTRIRSFPVTDLKDDGTPYVAGVDYDVREDSYTWFPDDWNGFSQLQLKRHPIVSVEGVAIKYGQVDPQLVLLMPEQWVVAHRRGGMVYVQPIVGVGTATASAMVLLPALGGDIIRRNRAIPCIVHVNYTAGYLPRDFDPEVDDPNDACPDFDVTGLLKAVSLIAASNVLLSLGVASDGDGGTISVDGGSETVNAGRFDKARENLETRAQKYIDQYLDEGAEAALPPMALI